MSTAMSGSRCKYPVLKDPGPKSHERYGFGTKDLKCWVPGPSGNIMRTLDFHVGDYIINWFGPSTHSSSTSALWVGVPVYE